MRSGSTSPSFRSGKKTRLFDCTSVLTRFASFTSLSLAATAALFSITAMASKLGVAATALAIAAVVLALNPPTTHHLLHPPPVPGAQDRLHASRVVPVTGAFGPESLAFDPSGGGPYTGVADGRVLKWEGDERGWVDFAFTSSQRYDVEPLVCSCSTWFFFRLIFYNERVIFALHCWHVRSSWFTSVAGVQYVGVILIHQISYIWVT